MGIKELHLTIAVASVATTFCLPLSSISQIQIFFLTKTIGGRVLGFFPSDKDLWRQNVKKWELNMSHFQYITRTVARMGEKGPFWCHFL